MTDGKARLRPVHLALFYASVLGWPVLPGHWLDEGPCCSCKMMTCGRPGAHPLADPPWNGVATTVPERVQEWWSFDPQASVLTVPRGFIGISVPALWGSATTVGEFDHAPVVDGRGAFTFLADTRGVTRHRQDRLAPLARVVARYGETHPRCVFAAVNARGYIPLPPSCGESPGLQYVWLTEPWRLDKETGESVPLALPLVADVVRALVTGAVATYEPDVPTWKQDMIVTELMGAEPT